MVIPCEEAFNDENAKETASISSSGWTTTTQNDSVQKEIRGFATV